LGKKSAIIKQFKLYKLLYFGFLTYE